MKLIKKKNQTGPLSSHPTQKLTQMAHSISVWAKTIKLLENKEANLHDLRLGSAFIMTAKHMQWQNSRLNFIKIKNFCAANDKVKRKPREWEQIFEKCISN